MTSTALVLAGRRPEGDPLAEAHGVSHKALIPVGGQPMIERVLAAIEDSGAFTQVAVCIDDPDALQGLPRVAALRDAGRLRVLPTAATPASSVIACLEEIGLETPVLVTTGDHPLLHAELLRDFWQRARAEDDAALAVGLVLRSLARVQFPSVNRTFLPLKGDAVTGANLFAFLGPESLGFARFWLRAEAHRKQPFRLLAPFGLGNLLLFALRRLDLDAAFARASKVVGVAVRPVPLGDARAALDVDREAHRELAEAILASDEAPAPSLNPHESGPSSG
ncbi:MAG: nucleotidyltransferase family protein [Myxococcota bacterium]|nr:nucleotidyltransferase family protein [Myxococcota bacterium]